MSTCTKWVDQLVITCKNWTSQLDHECTKWADEGYDKCDKEEDQGYNQCTKEEDQGYSECSRSEDQGYRDCCDWWPCSWACDAWTWISHVVCVVWTWISHVVCVVWTWISHVVCVVWHWIVKWACKAFAWIVKVICIVFSWFLKLVCVAWDTLRCALLDFSKWIVSLFSKDKGAAPKIEHVFVLALENRSFDHMLGFSGITGVDTDGNPASIELNPAIHKNVNPDTRMDVGVNSPADFQLKDVKISPGVTESVDPGHEFENTLTALCGKRAVYNPVAGGYPPINNSGFIQNYKDSGSQDPDRIMKCYSPDQLPVLTTLAKEFAVCDKWFSSLPGPTWPNRFFLLAATSGGLDGSPKKEDVVLSTTVEGYSFENGNIFDLLDDNCIEWRIFEGDEFPVSFALSGMNLNALQGRFKDFEDFESELNDDDLSEKFIFIEPKYGSHSFDVTGPGDYTCGNSMHPLDDVTRGEKLIKKVYETIRNSPHWAHSMLIVTFDEHGGFYDHIAPPGASSVPPVVAPGDTVTQDYVQHNFQFDQLGVRVPALVISPYTKKGVIDHTVYDHTSMLATVERLFGMSNLTNRDKAANDVLHLLSLDTPRMDAPAVLPDPAVNPHPLSCEEDDETDDELLLKVSELKIAKSKGIYRKRHTSEFKLTSTQVGFLQVALLKVLQTGEYSERIQWIDQYKDIKTGIDGAIFMTEAKLKLRHSINLKTCGGKDKQKSRRGR